MQIPGYSTQIPGYSGKRFYESLATAAMSIAVARDSFTKHQYLHRFLCKSLATAPKSLATAAHSNEWRQQHYQYLKKHMPAHIT